MHQKCPQGGKISDEVYKVIAIPQVCKSLLSQTKT